MPEKTKLIFAYPPELINTAAGKLGRKAAHMIYGIGRGFRLYRLRRANAVKDGYMVLDTSGYRGGGPSAVLVSDVLDECVRMGYLGIVIDSGKKPSPALLSLSSALAAAALKSGLSYFVPETLSDSGYNTIVRIPTALSGGTLHRHLYEAAQKYGASHVALEIERVRMDFTLPAKSGVGKELTRDSLLGLLAQHDSTAHYSADLAVNYFTYKDKKGPHFVLYDDSMSIRRKLSVAGNLGIDTAFFYYPRVADIYDEITG